MGFEDDHQHGAVRDADGHQAEERALRSSDRALIAHLKLEIAKLNRHRFGSHSERSSRLDQLELQLEELETSATQDELLAEIAAAKTTAVAGFQRKRPVRKPFPEHLPRERVVVAAPAACPCCGGARASPSSARMSPRPWR